MHDVRHTFHPSSAYLCVADDDERSTESEWSNRNFMGKQIFDCKTQGDDWKCVKSSRHACRQPKIVPHHFSRIIPIYRPKSHGGVDLCDFHCQSLINQATPIFVREVSINLFSSYIFHSNFTVCKLYYFLNFNFNRSVKTKQEEKKNCMNKVMTRIGYRDSILSI